MVAPLHYPSPLDVLPRLLEVYEATPAGMRMVCGLDARTGGGKSTAAYRLRDGLVPIVGEDSVRVAESDFFYSGEMTERCLTGQMHPGDPSWEGDYFFHPFAEFLRKARAGEPVRTAMKDWASGEETGTLDLEAARIVIATGCGILCDTFQGIFDFSGWVDCTREEAERRGRLRSERTNHPEHLLPGVGGWDSWRVWMEADERHIRTNRPHLRADFVINNIHVVDPAMLPVA
jgi:hypothetical protein